MRNDHFLRNARWNATPPHHDRAPVVAIAIAIAVGAALTTLAAMAWVALPM